MPLNAQNFTRAGGDPDLSALANAIRPTLGDPFYLGVSAGSVTVQKPTAWTGPQITAVQAAVTAAPAQTDETDAQNAIDSMGIFDQAVLGLILDEINIVRVALSLAPRTVNQLRTALRAKAGTL